MLFENTRLLTDGETELGAAEAEEIWGSTPTHWNKNVFQMKSTYQVQNIYTDLLQSPIEMVQIDNDSN